MVDALLEVATMSDRAADFIERLISSPDANLSRFEQKLEDLKDQNRYYDWRSVRYFASDLRFMLDDLRASSPTPEQAIRQIAALYESDEAVFNSGDDSSGDLGGFFQVDVLDLFCEYASQCADKDWVIETVLKLNEDDGYCVRDSLIEEAYRYLSTEELRKMTDCCLERAEREGADWDPGHWLRQVESLALQLKDAELYERVRNRGRVENSPAACLDIAQVYLNSGDAKRALEWTQKIPEDEHFREDERDSLLLEIQKVLGNHSAQEEIAWRSFKRHRDEQTFKTLLDVIGPENRDFVVDQSVLEIRLNKNLDDTSATFLIYVNKLAELEDYLMSRKNELNGDHYYSLLNYAEVMEGDKRYYAASIIYRELTDSILRRGVSKYYHHGVRYLNKLDRLSLNVNDWRGSEDHHQYFSTIKEQHSRKRAFWSQYGEV